MSALAIYHSLRTGWGTENRLDHAARQVSAVGLVIALRATLALVDVDVLVRRVGVEIAAKKMRTPGITVRLKKF